MSGWHSWLNSCASLREHRWQEIGRLGRHGNRRLTRQLPKPRHKRNPISNRAIPWLRCHADRPVDRHRGLAIRRGGIDSEMKHGPAGMVAGAAAFLLRGPAIFDPGWADGRTDWRLWLPVGLPIGRLAGMDAVAALRHTILKLRSAMLF
jgi:hypothetical protein